MCRRRHEYQPIGNNNVALVVQEIEIEARRLIIEYQRALLNEPPETQQIEQKPATLPITAIQLPASAPIAAPQAKAVVEVQGVKSIDAIMPLPKKKKPSMDDIEAGKQIDIEEAIGDAILAAAQKPEADVESNLEVGAPVQLEIQQPTPPMQTEAFEPRITLIDKWINFLNARTVRNAELKSRKLYYKALETQIKNNVAPLEKLIEFMHGKYGNN